MFTLKTSPETTAYLTSEDSNGCSSVVATGRVAELMAKVIGVFVGGFFVCVRDAIGAVAESVDLIGGCFVFEIFPNCRFEIRNANRNIIKQVTVIAIPKAHQNQFEVGFISLFAVVTNIPLCKLIYFVLFDEINGLGMFVKPSPFI
jgi:hypothetical protein